MSIYDGNLRFHFSFWDQADIPAHGQSGFAAGIGDERSFGITTEPQADRQWQLAEPSGNPGDQPVRGKACETRAAEQQAAARAAVVAGPGRERLQAGERPVVRCDPEVDELAEAELPKMPGRHPGDGRIIEMNEEGSFGLANARHIHHRGKR